MATRTVSLPSCDPSRFPAINVEVNEEDFIGLYAVHPYFKQGGAVDNRGRWTATHLPSGSCIGPVKSRLIARRLVKKLMPLTVDTPDASKAFSDPQAAMDVVILERRRAA